VDSHRKGYAAIEARYGDVRSFTLRTLYTWLTLTVLLSFGWPMLVVYADAPGVLPQDTPADWFQLRLLIAAGVAAVGGLLWRLSPVSTDTAQPGRGLALFSAARGRVWPQVMVFLAGLLVVLSALRLADDPAGAAQVIALGLAEALAVQLILCGYLQGAFELLLEDYRATLATLALFALTFAIRGGLASATEESVGQDSFTLALLAGGAVGVLAGGVSLLLRNRSGSVLPGILAHWLLLGILPSFFE
jgi:hypothetical protein